MTPDTGSPRSPTRRLGLALGLGATLALCLLPVADAWSRPRSSGGGYSRPSAPSRTPSFSPSPSPSRTPSSGGYARPGASAPSGGFSYDRGPARTPSSAADRTYNRQASGDALRRMRERDAAARQAPIPSPQGGTYGGNPGGGYAGPVPRGRSNDGWGGSWGGSWNTGANRGRPDWYRDRGWNPSGAVAAGPRGFGMWDAAFLWFLLSTLNRPGHADFFHNHRDDPGFAGWRRQVEQQAANDPEIRRQLDQLDRELTQREGRPRDPDYLPPDVPPEIAAAEETDASGAADGAGSGAGSGGGVDTATVVGAMLLGGGALGVLAWRRRRAAPGGGANNGAGGNARGGGGTMRTGTLGTLASAGDMLRHKMSGAGYAAERFRLGMPVTLDPTPFLLAGGAIKATPPSGGERASVAAIGRIAGEGAASPGVVHLYLSGDAMLRIVPAADGSALPQECRYFRLLDEVTPSSEEEWAAWLHEREGMIGWSDFHTRDGRTYARVWQPGGGSQGNKVPPRESVERVEDAQGTREVRHAAMLYAAPTGAPDPAPATEYVLVQTAEDAGQAWVEIWTGIDVNPASLGIEG